jgi:hypothetical protein
MAEDVASAVRQDRLVPNHFDVARAMVTARRGRRDAWEFLRRFTEQWATRLAMPDYPMWAAPQGPPIRWFSGPDVLIRDDSREWMWVAARTPEALQGVRQAIPGDWLIEPAP